MMEPGQRELHRASATTQLLLLQQALHAHPIPGAETIAARLNAQTQDPVLIAGRADALAASGDVAGGKRLIEEASAGSTDTATAAVPRHKWNRGRSG